MFAPPEPQKYVEQLPFCLFCRALGHHFTYFWGAGGQSWQVRAWENPSNIARHPKHATIEWLLETSAGNLCKVPSQPPCLKTHPQG